jgi:hypothetical protein
MLVGTSGSLAFASSSSAPSIWLRIERASVSIGVEILASALIFALRSKSVVTVETSESTSLAAGMALVRSVCIPFVV